MNTHWNVCHHQLTHASALALVCFFFFFWLNREKKLILNKMNHVIFVLDSCRRYRRNRRKLID